jgi:hypothetical protein
MRRDVIEADRTVMVTHRDVRALGDMMLDLPAWRGSAASSAASADPNVETSGLAPESLESGRRQTAQYRSCLTLMRRVTITSVVRRMIHISSGQGREIPPLSIS